MQSSMSDVADTTGAHHADTATDALKLRSLRRRVRSRTRAHDSGPSTPPERHVGSGTQSPLQPPAPGLAGADPHALRVALGRQELGDAAKAARGMDKGDALRVALEPRHLHDGAARRQDEVDGGGDGDSADRSDTLPGSGAETPSGGERRKIRFPDE